MYLKALFFCFVGTFFFGFLLNAPRKSLPISAMIGAMGYLIYLFVAQEGHGGEVLGYFFAGLFMALSAEIVARKIHMPATVFITVAIIPLVPGIMLYRTMLHLVKGANAAALSAGIYTLFAAGAIAIAIATSSLIIRIYQHIAQRRQKKRSIGA